MLFSNVQAPLAPPSAKQASFKAEHELITDLENSRSMNLASIVLRCIDIAPERSRSCITKVLHNHTTASLELSQSETDQRFQQKSAGC